jgi:DNA-binding IclR family transcriptional regulator
MRNTVQTVDRALKLLGTFAEEGEELGVTELAARLDVHKSTASRLAATLEARGFLERSEREAFRLGPELARLGRLARSGRDLVSLARGAMERLTGETGETVNLAVLDGEEAVNVSQVDGRHIVGVGSWTGRRTPLHCTANGKVLLAWSGVRPPEGLAAFTTRTITSPEALRIELERVRELGYATALGELEEGLHALAAPVLDRSERCAAALSISGPSYRMPARRLAHLAADCRSAADAIGLLLDGGVRAA